MVEEAEFFEDDFAALHALGVFILVEFFSQVFLDVGAGGEGTFDGVLDGKAGLVGGEFDEFIDAFEELFGLLGGDVGLGGRFCRLGGRAGLSRSRFG